MTPGEMYEKKRQRISVVTIERRKKRNLGVLTDIQATDGSFPNQENLGI